MVSVKLFKEQWTKRDSEINRNITTANILIIPQCNQISNLYAKNNRSLRNPKISKIEI